MATSGRRKPRFQKKPLQFHPRLLTKGIFKRFLRGMLKPSFSAQLGFVMPTAVMVSLVVILLTGAVLAKSFQRGQNATNTRINQSTLNAVTPAMNRAMIKIETLLNDENLPKSTPTDIALRNVMDDEKYTLPDEVRVLLLSDFTDKITDSNKEGADKGDKTFGQNYDRSSTLYRLENDETSNQAWKFPVDTDNNGRFDSYTLYTIAWRNPKRNATGAFARSRSPLDARTPPMDYTRLGDLCANANNSSASLVGESDWYQTGNDLSKSLFVYAATVPIVVGDPNLTGTNKALFEVPKSQTGFSGLEIQQDRKRIPLVNNAVLFEDDLDIQAGPEFRLNGRVTTNSNFMAYKSWQDITLYQVSSEFSCYYKEENSKIIVGGNVVNGGYGDTGDRSSVSAHLFQGREVVPLQNQSISSTNKTINEAGGDEAGYNGQAYNQRIDLLVQAAIKKGGAQTVTGTFPNFDVASGDPAEVIESVERRLNEDSTLDPALARQQQLEIYFRNRTRRVPFSEVAYGGAATTGFDIDTVLQGAGNSLRPPNAWMYPANLANGTSLITGLTLKTSHLEATEPSKQKTIAKENFLGDRIQVGNNLPNLWYVCPDGKADTCGNTGTFVSKETTQLVRTSATANAKWKDPTTVDRTRVTQVSQLVDLGVADRDGFWEVAAAEAPAKLLDNRGGLRVITGAGIYERKNSFLPPPPTNTSDGFYDDPSTSAVEKYSVVWPDTMPMTSGEKVYDNVAKAWTDLSTASTTAATPTIDSTSPKYSKGDLRMRASVVYHYKDNAYDADVPTTYQKPIACISSYYDPSTSVTAKNQSGLPWDNATGGKSNNGIVYDVPTTTAKDITGVASTDLKDGLFTSASGGGTEAATTLLGKLYYQANLVFPNGRFVNEPLRNALTRLVNKKSLSLSEQSAIDAALCALQIAADPTKFASAPTVPHGAIREVSLLDNRQIEAIDGRTLAITNGTSSTFTRTYTVAVPDGLALSDFFKQGDTVTIQGFVDNATTTTVNEALLNVTKGVVAATPAAGATQITVTAPISLTIAAPGVDAAAGVVELMSSRYDRSLELRQPMEVRLTQINLDNLRMTTIGTSTPSQEYLLPNTGIIYATRDDASQDLSDSSADLNSRKRLSATDYKLDPARRPNGIMLTNGGSLVRGGDTNNVHRPEEKGLVLVTNLPLYVQADANNVFNKHTVEEFKTALTANWSNFYGRNDQDPNFACRKNNPQLPQCTDGDTWRAASVIADAFVPLSNKFRLGFRNEGDYDLNNHQGTWESTFNRLRNGFWDNNFATNGLSSGWTLTDPDDSTKTKTRGVNGIVATDSLYSGNGATAPTGSSYFNNYVTPVQRRATFPEYIMEMCRKLPVSTCAPTDWVVDYDLNGDGALTGSELNIPARNLGRVLATNSVTSTTFDKTRLGAGTTAIPALQESDRRYARRIAFTRNRYNALVFDSIGATAATNRQATARPMGVDCPIDFSTTNLDNASTGCKYPDSNSSVAANKTPTVKVHYPTAVANALWFRTTDTVTGRPFCEAADLPAGLGCAAADAMSYSAAKPLFYLPPLKGGGKMILPDPPCFNKDTQLPCPSAPTTTDGIVNLNWPVSPVNTKASDFTVCVGGKTPKAGDPTVSDANKGSSNNYDFTGFSGGQPVCPKDTADHVDTIQNKLDSSTTFPQGGFTSTGFSPALSTSTTIKNNDVLSNSTSGVAGVITATKPVVVVDIPDEIANGTRIVLSAGSQADPVFVLRTPGGLLVGDTTSSSTTLAGVQVTLEGVPPNNVFWTTGNGALKFGNAASTNPHIFPGNFMGNGAGSEIKGTTQLIGARFLGYPSVPGLSSGVTITAVTADAQPLVVPVLQLQATAFSPGKNPNDSSGVTFVKNTHWRQRAESSTFNIAIAAGNTPGRAASSTAGTGAELDGGLANFMRFAENWIGSDGKNRDLTMSGSFIELRRSIFATGPQQPVLFSSTTALSTQASKSLFGYFQAYRTDNSKVEEEDTVTWGRHPHYDPPNRKFGFDVALLTQLPDLFAERFTVPSTNYNQFFREIRRDDPVIKALMCAFEPDDVTNNDKRVGKVESKNYATVYTKAAVPAGPTSKPNPYRPKDCPTAVPTLTP